MSAAEPEIVQPDPPKKSKALTKRENGAIAHREPERATIEQMIMRALEMDKPELIDKFVAIYEKQETERKKAAFNTALAAFQLECPVILKKQRVKEREDKGGRTRYTYAAQEDMDRVIKPILGKHGLSYSTSTRIESTEPKQAFLIATCHARHSEGFERDTEFRAPIDFESYMTNQQKYASAATFCERYAIKHAFGVVFAGDDDDGQFAAKISPAQGKAMKVTQPKQTPTAQKAETKANGEQRPDLEPAPEGEAIDPNTVKGLTAAMEHATLSGEDFKRRFPKLSGLEQVHKSNARVVMSWIADPVHR